MKNVLSLFICLLCISFIGFSQEKNNYDNLTSGKWQIESVEIENDIMNVSDEGHWMVFYANGLYQIMLDQEEKVGTWSIDEKNEINFDSEALANNSNINKLSDRELRFSISGYTLALVK